MSISRYIDRLGIFCNFCLVCIYFTDRVIIYTQTFQIKTVIAKIKADDMYNIKMKNLTQRKFRQKRIFWTKKRLKKYSIRLE